MVKIRENPAELAGDLDHLGFCQGAPLLQDLLQRVARDLLFNHGQALLIFFRQKDRWGIGNGMLLQISVDIGIIDR